MFCTECGTKNTEPSKFCRQCGHALESSRVREEAYIKALPAEEQVGGLLERAYRLIAAEDLSGAVAVCEEALRLLPESTSAHSLLGQVFALQGEREKAVAEYEKVLKINPGSIADRVKLDELRDAGRVRKTPAASSNAKYSAPLGVWNIAALACACLALTGTGVVIAMQMRSRSQSVVVAPKPNTPVVTASNTPTRDANAIIVPPNNAKSSAETTETPVSPTPPTRTVFVTPSGAPALPGQQNSPAPVTQPLPTMPAKSNAAKTMPTPSKSADKSGGRVVLNEGDGVTKDRDGHYTIRITAKEGKDSSALPPGNSVRVAPGNDGGRGSNAPEGNARAALSAADDLRFKGEFDKAIKMYQKALPGAGDRSGYVYEKLAYCFQQKGDRSSAKVNYERAINEYQKQVAAGHSIEIAQNSIRACERGIRVCQ